MSGPMLSPRRVDLLPLRAALERCADAADDRDARQYLAVRQAVAPCDPLQVYARSLAPDRCFWARPSEDFALAATGRVGISTPDAAQADRFTASSRVAQRLFASMTVVGDEDAPEHAGPLLLAGFAFSAQHTDQGEWRGFPGTELLLPRTLVVRLGKRAFVTCIQSIDPGCDRDALWASLQQSLSRGLSAAAGSAELPAGAVRPSPLHSQPPFEPGAEYRVVADREHAVYRRQVSEALGAIARGELQKVVLARSLQVEHPGSFSVEVLLDRLRQLYPDCVTYAVTREACSFVCASPERLVSLNGGKVLTGALAGSAARGQTPEEDGRLAEQLMRSGKERAEHAAVVDAIRAALKDICWPLQGSQQPELMRLAGIQHLHTPLTGRLLEARGAQREPGAGYSILDLVGRLHPTPAVGGLPHASALDWIEQREGLQRGWFGGPVGFVDRCGGGEFRVALRAGIIRNPAPRAMASASGSEACGPAVARLFAGAGIVRGSSPEQELRETRLKLRALLAPLTEI